MDSPQSSTKSPDQIVTKHWERLAKLKAWMGVIANQKLHHEAQRQQKNQEAEERAVRKGLWGSSESDEAEDMGHVILGDVITEQTSKSTDSALKTIVALALAGTLGAGGLLTGAAATYLLTKPQPTAPVPDTSDESVSLGLGRIEDYLNVPN